MSVVSSVLSVESVDSVTFTSVGGVTIGFRVEVGRKVVRIESLVDPAVKRGFIVVVPAVKT